MKRIAILVVTLPVLALCAGVVAGMLASRLPAPNGASGSVGSSTSSDGQTYLTEELQLSPQQRDQMREIWEAVRTKVRRAGQDALNLQRQRDDSLVALLNDDQKAQFEKISKTYAGRYAELAKARDRAFEDAVDQTRKLLDQNQRQKYEQILTSHIGPGGIGHGSEVGLPPTANPAGPTAP